MDCLCSGSIDDNPIESTNVRVEKFASLGMNLDATKDEHERMIKLLELEVESAKDYLHDRFGISNLSTIEKVRLNGIVRECLSQSMREGEARQNENVGPTSSFNSGEEAAVRWLKELYGISFEQIQRIEIVNDRTSGKLYSFAGLNDDAAKQKVEELEKQGHFAFINNVIPDDFKEYVRRLRANAHII